MDLSCLESADPIETKALNEGSFGIVWDHLGWFRPQVVPVLFPNGEMLSDSPVFHQPRSRSHGRALPKSKTRPSGVSEKC
jgi:hypothetical protein